MQLLLITYFVNWIWVKPHGMQWNITDGDLFTTCERFLLLLNKFWELGIIVYDIFIRRIKQWNLLHYSKINII